MSSGIQNPEDFYKNLWANKCIVKMNGDYTKLLVNNINFKQQEHILDYGCGTGTFFKKYMFDIAAKNKMKLVGVDISDQMIESANSDSFYSGVTEYYVGNALDGSNWPLEHLYTFDRIFAFYVVHTIENYGDLFCTFNKYLKPKGTFSAVIPTSPIFQMFKQLSKDPFWAVHSTGGGGKYYASWITKDANKGEFQDFKPAMMSAGFKIVEYHQYAIQIKFEDIFECLDFLIMANGPLSTISINSKLYEKLREDLLGIVKDCLNIDVNQKPFYCDWGSYCFTGEKMD